MMTDPIADMLTRIRNAQAARAEQVLIPFSKLKQAVAAILERERYLAGLSQINQAGAPHLVLRLKYNAEGKPVISRLKRISRPSHRVYSKKDELPKVLNNYGLALISTSAGLMTNKEAKERGLGGEIICEVY